ncbi:MAG: response regulator [Bacteroidota bacterium]|nr:response regulator [Bacteroidota bacterium]
MLATNNAERQAALQSVELASADVQVQFNILKEGYLGNQSDLDEAYNAFLNWKVAREVNVRLAADGRIEDVKKSLLPTGAIGKCRELMMAKIMKIDDFEQKRSELLYANTNKLKDSLDIQLILLVCAIIILSVVVIFLMLRNIRTPITELTNAAKRFHNGDMSARSRIDTTNEYGALSDSFNIMVESIQNNLEITEKSTNFAELMLLEEDPKKFFSSILPALASGTNSQMAAVYLLSEDKKRYEHFESFGLVDTARQSFAVDNFEGEFGQVLVSRKIHSIKRIPIDTRFVFNTVSGKMIPREIISIPIISGNEIIAVISLASIRTYSEQSRQFINNLLYALSARIAGVLSYQKIQVFAKKLEFQNTELEAQKIEMTAQSTELKEQNRELEMQKIQLGEANRLKTNFLSNMSHELRTPLNSVIALSGVLNRRLAHKIPADEYSYLEVIERNGKNLLALINDILDISRIEAGHEEIEITKFSSNDLVTEIVSMIHPQAELKNIELMQTDNENELFITSDHDKCRHILQNLVGNAVKFTEKGKVEISTFRHGNKLEITVKDTGIGIAEKHLSHIFDEFRQADGGTSRRFGGTGLGLAIAKRYANLLGGTITVQSKLGEGSLFTLSLPLNYKAENKIIEPISSRKVVDPVRTVHSQDSQKTILLVDDSEPAIIQLKDFMEESGYKILVAHDGAEALDIISKVIPDAMILDLMMPEMDGFEVLKTIRGAESTALIPVLILTAKHITKEDLKFLKRNNVHQLIQKGDVNRTELLSSVASLVLTEEEEEEKPKKEIQNIEGKPAILIVEDNQDNMLTLKAILEDNYTLLEAEDGTQGIYMAKKHTPHLILMDIALPGIDGIEAFKSIRHTDRLAHIPVIALTANAMALDRETILAHGFNGYISKPIDERGLFSTINEVLYGK